MLFASITSTDWGAISGVVVAALAFSSFITAKLTKVLKAMNDKRELEDQIHTAFRGTPPNKVTGDPGSPPLLIQMTTLTKAVTELTNGQAALIHEQVEDRKVLNELIKRPGGG